MRRVHLQKLSRVGEELIGRHRVDLNLRRCFHVDGRIDVYLHWCRRFAPLREWRDFIAGLYLVNGVVVGWPIRLGSPNDPHERRRRINTLDVAGEPEFLEPLAEIRSPARRSKEEIPCLRTRGPPSRRGKYVGPHVEHWQKVIATISIGRGDDHRLPAQVEPGNGIKGIKVYSHHGLEICGRIFRHAGERIHWAFAKLLAGLNVCGLLPCHIHCHEWIEIEISVNTDGACLLLRDSRLRASRRR